MGLRKYTLLTAAVLSLYSCAIEPRPVITRPVAERRVFPDDFFPGEYLVDNIRVIDGDTIEADVHLQDDLILHDNFRLGRIDAPELRGRERPEGERSREYLSSLLKGSGIKGSIGKRGKYGRWLIELYDGEVNLNQKMVDDGFAEPYGK